MTKPLTLPELQALCDAADNAPWEYDPVESSIKALDPCSGRMHDVVCGESGTPYGINYRGNAAFITAARTALPQLIKRCQELEAENHELKYRLDGVQHMQHSTDCDWWGDNNSADCNCHRRWARAALEHCGYQAPENRETHRTVEITQNEEDQ